MITNRLTILFILIIAYGSLFSQFDVSSQKAGKMYGKIFFDAFTQLGSESSISGMEIKRAYFSYKYQYDKNFYALLKVDIGSPEDDSRYSLLKRYAYFKNVGIGYKKDKFTFNIGIIDMLAFKHQEKIWGHRYINKVFLDRYKFSPSADIGFNASYDFNKYISVNLGFYNGEGYANIQSDNSYNQGLGIISHPLSNSTIKIYLDYTKKEIVRWGIYTFASYTIQDKITISSEYNFQANSDYNINDNRFGYSIYSSYDITTKYQLFARYDKLNSNVKENDDIPWNIHKDGSAITAGVQVTLIDGLRFSVNYQDWYPYAANGQNLKFLFFNLEANF
jgi:hypothetical protein